MAALRGALPVVLCGRTSTVGRPVATALLPEYEVVRFIQTNEQVLQELPRLLAGQQPISPPETDIGSNDHSRPPRAVIFGRGYSVNDVNSFREASKGMNKEPIAWLAGDPAKKPPPNVKPGPDYAKAVTKSCKDALTGWVERGASKEEMILF